MLLSHRFVFFFFFFFFFFGRAYSVSVPVLHHMCWLRVMLLESTTVVAFSMVHSFGPKVKGDGNVCEIYPDLMGTGAGRGSYRLSDLFATTPKS